MVSHNVISQLRKNLENASEQSVKFSSQRFFKEPVNCYGISSNKVGQIAKTHLAALTHLNKAEIFGLCDELWQSGYIEESFVACNWAYSLRKNFEPKDLDVFQNWVEKYVDNWASCDTLCNNTIGSVVEKHPELLSRLKQWALSPTRWMRRAAAVSLIVPARKGLFLADILEISDLLREDNDDMVQKGYGWLLKVASKEHLHEIFDYVMKHKNTMPRTALRYAIEKMPIDLKKMAMAKP